MKADDRVAKLGRQGGLHNSSSVCLASCRTGGVLSFEVDTHLMAEELS